MDKFFLFFIYAFLIANQFTNAVSATNLGFKTQRIVKLWWKLFGLSDDGPSKFIKVTTAASVEAAVIIPHQLDIYYGSTPKTRLDIFGTDLPNDAPILVYVHGGAWQEESIRGTTWFPSHPLYRCGVKTVIVEYDVCPDVTLPQIVEQLYDAARYVFGYAEKMGSRGVYFAGHSAGGHLVAKILSNAVLLESTKGADRLQGAFLISGLFDLRPILNTDLNEAIQLPDELAVPVSPMFDDYSRLPESGIRIYIVAGEKDSPMIKTQSRDFHEVLQNTTTTNLYFKILDAEDHYSIAERLAQNNNYLQNWLKNDLKNYTV